MRRAKTITNAKRTRVASSGTCIRLEMSETILTANSVQRPQSGCESQTSLRGGYYKPLCVRGQKSVRFDFEICYLFRLNSAARKTWRECKAIKITKSSEIFI